MDALDRELAAELSVDPSPEFVARVRERMATEPAPSSWRVPQMVMAAAALTVIVIAISMSRVDQTPGAPAALLPSTPIAHSTIVSGFNPTAASASPRRRHSRRPLRANPIQLVSIDDFPTAPIGAVVPQMTFDVVTMTGVHP